MSDETWRIEVAGPARRDLRRLDPPVRRRVLIALRTLVADDPLRPGALRNLTGQPEHRLRIGDWRVLVLLDAGARIVTVTRVLPRGRAYDR